MILVPPSMNKRELTLRQAAISDTQLVAEMHARSWAATYRGTLPERYLNDEMPAERLAYWQEKMPKLADGSGAVFIAELAGKPGGLLCVIGPDHNHGVLVDNLHAMPEYKGSGAGTAMLETAAQWAIERGAFHLHLLVLEQNLAAIGFYESRGWRRVGKQDAKLGNIDVAALIYVRTLEGRDQIL
jgi:GNAT superfamily N-acetyltransferase